MAPLVLDYFSQKVHSLFFSPVPVPTKSDKQLARGDFSKKLLSIRKKLQGALTNHVKTLIVYYFPTLFFFFFFN